MDGMVFMKEKIEKGDIAQTLDGVSLARGEKISKRWIIVGVGLTILLVGGFVFFKGGGSSAAVQYKTQEVQRGNLMVIVTATGTLKPINNTVSVGSELSGIVKAVDVDYNSRVKAGQILARLDTTKLEAQVTQSKASLESAQAKVLQTQATIEETQSKLSQYKKVRELSQNKVPSQAEMDAAQAALSRALAENAAARAAVSQAEATLAANLTDLSKAVIRSPIDGVVLTRDVEPGQTVAAAYQAPTLFTLAADLRTMELHVNVDEADVGQVREGQRATFSVAAYANRIFDAQIVRVNYGSTTTSGVVTYETVMKVNNPDLLLRPGMTATADIIVKKIENALLVPSAALRFVPPADEGNEPSRGLIGAILPRPPKSESRPSVEVAGQKNQRVWILKEGRPSSVTIITGASSNGMTEVISGPLKPGMPLVVDTISIGKP